MGERTTVTTAPLLHLRGVSKSYPGVKALSDVSLHVSPGEVHALLGENGAGKSTLIKIMMGAIQRDEGQILWDGAEVEIRSPLKAQALGLAAVYQDVTLAQPLTVGENFFMGHLPIAGGLVDWPRVWCETDAFLRQLGIATDARLKVAELPIAQQQLIAIAKVVWGGARLIIFDEPTALLTNTETDTLFGIITRLRAEDKAIIYISHRLEEVFRICDSATILKDGRLVKRVQVCDVDEDQIVSQMVGRTLDKAYPHRDPTPGAVVLTVRGLKAAGRLNGVDLTVRRGEILGMYGLVGAGRTELMRVIFGADDYDEGEITLDDKPIRPRTPLGMIQKGMALLTEDRKHQSLALQLDILTNINLVRSQSKSRAGFLDRGAEQAVAKRFIDALNIRTPSPFQKAINLSGGNQQKVVIAKWLATDPHLILFDEPTIGVDVGARLEIYSLIHRLADEGRAIVMVSSYLPEVIGMSDRISVMHKGLVMGTIVKDEATEELLLRLASGLPA